MANKVTKFLGEVKAELKKVAWPSKEELKGSTIVVITITALLGLYIGAIDFVVSRVITFLIR